MAITTGIDVFAVVFFVIAIVYIAAVSLVIGTLGTIFQAALYVYATTGKAPLDSALMQSAFVPKAAK
jgi:hypothetical protein